MVSVKARSRVSFWQHSSCKTAQRLSLQHPGRCLLTALVLTAILLILLVSYMRLSDEGAIPSLEMISLDTALQQRKAAEWHAVDGLQQQQQSQNTFRALSSYPDERKAARAYVKSFKKLGRPLIFLHIPKTAGTAIEFAAGKKRIAWGSCLFNHKPKRDICRYPAGAECTYHRLQLRHDTLMSKLTSDSFRIPTFLQGPRTLVGGTYRLNCFPSRTPTRTKMPSSLALSATHTIGWSASSIIFVR